MPEERMTFCRICESLCGLSVKVEGNQVTQITGDPHHPLSQGRLCVKGRALTELHHDPDRLRSPVRRTAGGGWEPIPWESALDEVARRVTEIRDRFGPRSVALYSGTGAMSSSLTLGLLSQFIRGLSLSNVYSSMTIDCVSLNLATSKVLGDALYIPLPDWERSQFMLLLGHNPIASRFGQFQTLPRGLEQLRAARANGARLVVVDPRRTETAHQADEHHFIRPGTDLFLVLGLLHTVLSEELEDKDFIRRHTAGFSGLRTAAAAWPPERAAALTGIPAETIVRLAREFAAAPAAFCVGHTGVSQGPHGSLAEWAILALNAVTGNLDRPGGLRWCDPVTAYLPAGRTRRAVPPPERSRVGGWPRFLGEFPTATLADEILTEGPDQVRALVVVGGNPVLTAPNSEKLARALARLDLLVCVDLYVNQTAAFAHYVLPAADQLERADVTHPLVGRNTDVPFVQYTPAVVPPVGDVREDWRILRDLNRRLGISEFGNPDLEAEVAAVEAAGGGPADVTDALLDHTLTPSGLTVAQLRNAPHGVVLGERKYGQMREKGWPTPDGKVRLDPLEFTTALERLVTEEPRTADDSFLLVGRRQVRTHNSSLHNLQSLRSGEGEPQALLNDHDAARLGIGDGQWLFLFNRVGRIRVQAHPSPDIAPGVVVMPHGWGHQHPSGQTLARTAPGANPNVLIDDACDLEPFTGNPRQNGTRVWVAIDA